METIGKIKNKYDDAFTAGERVFAISHSQGSLFMNDVYNLLLPSMMVQDDTYKYFAGFQIPARPLYINRHFRILLT